MELRPNFSDKAAINIMGTDGVHNHRNGVDESGLSTAHLARGDFPVEACVRRCTPRITDLAGMMLRRPQSTSLITRTIVNHHPMVSITASSIRGGTA